MKQKMSKPGRRVAVIINYGCIIMFLVFFYIGTNYGWNAPVAAGTILSVVLAIISFILLHIRTHLWKLVHAKINQLDEREVQITHESLRRSYAIFTVISLLVLMCMVLLMNRHDSILIIIFASLLYLAHTLPSSIIAWTEKEV